MPGPWAGQSTFTHRAPARDVQTQLSAWDLPTKVSSRWGACRLEGLGASLWAWGLLDPLRPREVFSSPGTEQSKGSPAPARSSACTGRTRASHGSWVSAHTPKAPALRHPLPGLLSGNLGSSREPGPWESWPVCGAVAPRLGTERLGCAPGRPVA